MTEKIVQGDFKRRVWWRTRQFLIVLIVITLIAILGAAWQWYRTSHDQSKKQASAYTTMLDRSNKLIAARQYSTAEQIVKWYLDAKPPATYKRDANAQLASIYSTAGDLSNALQWYKNTAQLDKSPQLDAIVGIAYAYQALKDNQNAIKYFRQAITLEQKTNAPDKNSVITTYQYLIKQMGGAV